MSRSNKRPEKNSPRFLKRRRSQRKYRSRPKLESLEARVLLHGAGLFEFPLHPYSRDLLGPAIVAPMHSGSYESGQLSGTEIAPTTLQQTSLTTEDPHEGYDAEEEFSHAERDGVYGFFWDQDGNMVLFARGSTSPTIVPAPEPPQPHLGQPNEDQSSIHDTPKTDIPADNLLPPGEPMEEIAEAPSEHADAAKPEVPVDELPDEKPSIDDGDAGDKPTEEHPPHHENPSDESSEESTGEHPCGDAPKTVTVTTKDSDGGYTETTKDNKGVVISTTKYNQGKTKVETTTYDPEQKKTTKTTYHTGELKSELIELGDSLAGKPKKRVTTTTTEDGQVVKEEEFTYTEDGHFVDEVVTKKFDTGTHKTYQYDKDGNLMCIFVRGANTHFIYNRDANGKLINVTKHVDKKEVGRVQFDKNGKVIKRSGNVDGVIDEKTGQELTDPRKKDGADELDESESDSEADPDDTKKEESKPTGKLNTLGEGTAEQPIPKYTPAIGPIEAEELSDKMLEIEIESGPRLIKHFLDKAKKLRDQAARHREAAKQRRADAEQARKNAKDAEEKAQKAKDKDAREFQREQAKTHQGHADELDKGAEILDESVSDKEAAAESYEQDAGTAGNNYGKALAEQIQRSTGAADRAARAAEAARIEAERVEAERRKRLQDLIRRAQQRAQQNAEETSESKPRRRTPYRPDGREPQPGKESRNETLRKLLD